MMARPANWSCSRCPRPSRCAPFLGSGVPFPFRRIPTQISDQSPVPESCEIPSHLDWHLFRKTLKSGKYIIRKTQRGFCVCHNDLHPLQTDCLYGLFRSKIRLQIGLALSVHRESRALASQVARAIPYQLSRREMNSSWG